MSIIFIVVYNISINIPLMEQSMEKVFYYKFRFAMVLLVFLFKPQNKSINIGVYCKPHYFIFAEKDEVIRFHKNNSFQYLDNIIIQNWSLILEKYEELDFFYNNPILSLCKSILVVILTELFNESLEHLKGITLENICGFANKYNINIENKNNKDKIQDLRLFALNFIYEMEYPINTQIKIIEHLNKLLIVRNHEQVNQVTKKIHIIKKSRKQDNLQLIPVEWNTNNMTNIRMYLMNVIREHSHKSHNHDFHAVFAHEDTILYMLIKSFECKQYDVCKIFSNLMNSEFSSDTKKHCWNYELNVLHVPVSNYKEYMTRLLSGIEIIFRHKIGCSAITLLTNNIIAILDISTWAIFYEFLNCHFEYVLLGKKLKRYQEIKQELYSKFNNIKLPNGIKDIEDKIFEYKWQKISTNAVLASVQKEIEKKQSEHLLCKDYKTFKSIEMFKNGKKAFSQDLHQKYSNSKDIKYHQYYIIMTELHSTSYF